MPYAERQELMRQAEMTIMVRLVYGYDMLDDCLLCYDSGGRKQYVVGWLDNGKPFAARCPNQVPIYKPVVV